MPLATPRESMFEFAHNVGMDNPDQEWISTPYDTWERNPFYHGIRHVDPETADAMATHAEEAGKTLTEEDLRIKPLVAAPVTDSDDDINCPF